MRSTCALATTLGLAALLPCPPAGGAEPAAIRVIRLDGTVVEGRDLRVADAALHISGGGTDDASVTVPLIDVLEAWLPEREFAFPERSAGPPLVEVDLTNRDRMVGYLVAGDGEVGFELDTRFLGRIAVSLETVARVRFVAAWRAAIDPPALTGAEDADRFVFASGDRLDGTLRSVDPEAVRLRTDEGVDRALPVGGLLGFALLPLPAPPEDGLRVRLRLHDGSRLSGTGLATDATGDGLLLSGMLDGRTRPVPREAVAGLTVRGGRGAALTDLEPASIEVRSWWGDEDPILPRDPRFDRAFTLDPGPPPPLRLGGRTWARGVSMLSGTTVTWDLTDRGFRAFTAGVGVDDAGPSGQVEFEVLVDGRSAWKSGVVGTVARGEEPLAVPSIDLTGASRLALRVLFGPGADVQDYADWVRPALTR